MAESVDALVSNTSGAIRAGSTPALGTIQSLAVLFSESARDFLLLSWGFVLKSLSLHKVDYLRNFQSLGYVYDFLEKEMTYGKMR